MDPDEILAEGAEQLQAEPQAQAPPEAEGYRPPSETEMREIAQAYFALQQQNANLQAAYQAQMQQTQQPPELEEYDDPNAIDNEDELDPASIRAMIREEALAAQRLALNEHPMFQQIAEQRGQEIANQAFDAWKPEIGDINRELAVRLANGISAENPTLQPMQALRLGAEQARQFRDAERSQAAQSYQTTVENRLAASQPVPPGAASAAVEGRKPASSYEDVAANFISRRGGLQVSAN